MIVGTVRPRSALEDGTARPRQSAARKRHDGARVASSDRARIARAQHMPAACWCVRRGQNSCALENLHDVSWPGAVRWASAHASLSLVRVTVIKKHDSMHLITLASMINAPLTHTTRGAKAYLASRQRQSAGEVSSRRIRSHSTAGQPEPIGRPCQRTRLCARGRTAPTRGSARGHVWPLCSTGHC